MLTIQNILNDIKLCFDGWRIYHGSISLQRRNDLERLIILAFPNQQTRGVREERTDTPNQHCEEDLKGKWEAPRHTSFSEGETES